MTYIPATSIHFITKYCSNQAPKKKSINISCIQFRLDQQFFHHFMRSFSPNLAPPQKKNNVCRRTVISGKVSTSAGNTSMVASPASGSAPSKARRALVEDEECLVTVVPSISPGILCFNIYTINKTHYVDTIYSFIVCTVYIQIVHVNILLLYTIKICIII